MARWETRTEHRADVSAEAIWARAYTDASAWPAWNPEIAAARLEGSVALDARAWIRFRTGARLRFVVTEFADGRLFTDEAPNTISLDSPLAPLWARLLGRRAAATQHAIVALVRGAHYAEL